MVRFRLCVFGKDTTALMCASPCITSGVRCPFVLIYLLSICPEVGDVGYDHLIQVVSDMCFLCEVILSLCN